MSECNLSGSITMVGGIVRFSDNVGSCVTREQTAVLYRTAKNLGKKIYNTRYPLDSTSRMIMESCTDKYELRNEHGVPYGYLIEQIRDIYNL